MLPDTNRDEHWRTTFSNLTCHSICNSVRWICVLKIHSATRRQNAIPIFARNSVCVTFVHGGDVTHRLTNTWWGRSMVCLSADWFAENLLESSGADVKRSSLDGTKWNFGVEMDSGISGPPLASRRDEGQQQQKQQQHRNLRHNLTVMNLTCVDKECTRKHSGSEPSGQKSAEPLDAWHARLPVRESHTLANAEHIKMPGTRAAEPHQRRRRNVELLQIQIHDHWTRVEVRWIYKNDLCDRQREPGRPDG